MNTISNTVLCVRLEFGGCMVRFLIMLLVLMGMMFPRFSAEAAPFSEKAASLARISAVRMGGSMERLRIVLDANKEVDYSVMVLSNPSRVVVNLHGAWLSPEVARETVIGSRFASKVRIAQFNEDTVRVVVETTMGKGHYDVFSIESGTIPYRVVMDFGKVGTGKEDAHGGTLKDDREGTGDLQTGDGKTGGQEKPGTTGEVSTDQSGEDKESSKPEENKKAEKEKKEKEKKEEKDKKEKAEEDEEEEEALSEDFQFSPGIKGKKIVIDPGHGGEDCGAIGASGSFEKTITLQIAKEVEKLLKEAGAKVIMTRTTDTEVSPKHRMATDVDELQARCDVANKAKADIFVSIHMDSFTSREASGTTGYYYTKGSAASKRLAAAIQSNLISQLKTTSRGVKTCNFYVVKHTKMPATLIEVAFVSNPKEERLLTSKKGVQKAAVGIVKGISDFFGEKE